MKGLDLYIPTNMRQINQCKTNIYLLCVPSYVQVLFTNQVANKLTKLAPCQMQNKLMLIGLNST